MQLITPQKKPTPDLKELSPLPNLFSHRHRTIKLEILQSPVTPNKDLFHQLITVENPPSPVSPHFNIFDLSFEIMEEQDSEDPQSRSDFQDNGHIEYSQSQDDNEDEQGGLKKRKRKSTTQIKVLKAELDVQSNWSKEKIAEMSDKTGLSQSQVYKWWWDQKKKNVKEEKNLLEKRKFIKKETFRKGLPYDKTTHGYYLDESLLTKPKSAIEIEEVPATQKKINKRLVFH